MTHTNNFPKDKDFSNLKHSTDSKAENLFTTIGLLTAIIEDLSSSQKIEFFKRLIDFAQFNNIKELETLNVVSETGDSIYSPLLKELPIEEKGQVFISEDKIEEIVQEKLDKRLGAIKQEK